MKISYEYQLTGELEFNIEDYHHFCKRNSLESNDKLDPYSVKEFILEKFDLIQEANDGNLKWISVS